MNLTLRRTKFAAFLACQRRFELRYLRQLPWPDAPLSEQADLVQGRGQQFHQLLERHFLGLPVEANEIEDSVLRKWWLAFQSSKLPLPNGRSLPELSLTIPVGGHLLNGRFDLLITDGIQAHIFDWKTGKPQPEDRLRHDWQTRLYLAMVAESNDALGAQFAPNHIALTYWYVSEPNDPRTIRYNQSWHKQNWAEIEALIMQIDERLQLDVWPLTDDLAQCRVCAYQACCGRQAAGTAESSPDEETEEAIRLQLEPNIP
jgi:CRISPR/Cas system-associated exonuclease Cas4 (RecB family)